MIVIKKYLSDFKGSFRGNTYIASYTAGQATGEFFKLFLGPFYLTMIIGFIILVTGETWDAILINAIHEFMQVTGLKLSFYSIICLIVFSMLFYEIHCLTRVLSWLVNYISHAAFTMLAVVTGVLWGILIPSCIDAQSISPLYATILFSILAFSLSIIFFLSPRFFCTDVRKKINDFLGDNTRKVTFLVGTILLVFLLQTVFFDEEWKEIRLETQMQENLTK